MGVLYNKLVSLGLLTEMNDWKSHFTNGTKGMPKTEPGILNYVENVLKRSYDGNEERAKNNPLAPWLVMTVKAIGPENINSATLNKIKNVIEYFKVSGNASNLKANRNPDGSYNVTPLDQADSYATEKLNKIRQKAAQKAGENPVEPEKKKAEEPVEPDKVEGDIEEPKIPEVHIPLLIAETKGEIERVWVAKDGSGRMWVKVIDTNWLTKACNASHAMTRNWGVMCQADSLGAKFRDGSHTNYQFIGPAKDKQKKEYSTIVGLAVKNFTGLIAELKQEGNVQPGSQKSSGGWSDADIQTIEFLSHSEVARNAIKGFGTYSGTLPTGTAGTYGGDSFLTYIAGHKVELVNELADARPDIIDTNIVIIKNILGDSWLDERVTDIRALAESKPVEFLKRFEIYFKKFGREAVDVLNTLDIEGIAKKNPQVVLDSLGSLIGNIPGERFMNLIKGLDLQKFIAGNTESFKSLIKNMANVQEYQTLFKDIINNNSLDIIKSFGNGGVGIFKFLQFASTPRLRQHQSAVLDPATGQYIGTRDVVENPGAGHENRIVKKQKFIVPDNLRILNQKERRDFIYKHKDYIKSLTPTLDEKSKEINFLRFVFSESNQQDIERTLNKEREDYIKYYDTKFQSGETKKVRLSNGQMLESPYLPGIFEFYNALNKKKPGYAVAKPMNTNALKPRATWRRDNEGDTEDTVKNITYYTIPINDIKKYTQDIVKYYYTIRKNASKKSESTPDYTAYNPEMQKAKKLEAQENEAKIRFGTAKDYLYTLQLAGMSDEELVNEMKEQFTPEKMRTEPKLTIKYYMENIIALFDDVTALNLIRGLERYCNALGSNGEIAYKTVVGSLYKLVYLVKPGDAVQYIPFNEKTKATNSTDYGQINLTSGRKYQVLGVRNSGVINGEVLVIDEGAVDGVDREDNEIIGAPPQERWLGSYLFEIKTIKVLPDEIAQYEVDNGEDIIQEVRLALRKRIQMIAERVEKKKRISYTGVVLDNKSKDRLYEFIKDMKKAKKIMIPDDWEFSADHLTINMGPAYDPSMLGQKALMKVLTFAYDDNVIAVGVKPELDIEFEKENPHITIAFNALGGARPVMSNKLTKWKPVPKAFIISGTVQEVMQDIE